MHSAEPTMETVMRPPVHTVTPQTPLDDARQLFIAETMRSLIVVDQDRPVGIVSWAEIGTLNMPIPGKTVADAMTPNPHAVERTAPLSAARSMLETTDHDLIPVVDQTGTLVGEALRREILSPDQPYAPEMATMGASVGVQQGMEVTSPDGDYLGTIERVLMDAQGRITHIEVSSGRLLKHHKRIPADLVSRVEGQSAIAAIDKGELKRLPDV